MSEVRGWLYSRHSAPCQTLLGHCGWVRWKNSMSFLWTLPDSHLNSNLYLSDFAWTLWPGECNSKFTSTEDTHLTVRLVVRTLTLMTIFTLTLWAGKWSNRMTGTEDTHNNDDTVRSGKRISRMTRHRLVVAGHCGQVSEIKPWPNRRHST